MTDALVPVEDAHVAAFEQYTRPRESLQGSRANGRKCRCEWASRTGEDGAGGAGGKQI